MGEVWSATQTRRGGAPVAIKVLTAAAARLPERQAAFREEVRLVAALRHPSIIEVHDTGRVAATDAAASGGRLTEGTPYLVMALADGVVSDAPMPWSEFRATCDEVLRGLAHAHARRVLHLDLKPSNLLRIAGRVVIADFGIAALWGDTGGETVRGSLACMAPEQLFGQSRDFCPATDLYAVGIMVWRWLCGTPFLGDSTTLEQARSRAMLAPPTLPGDLGAPPGLQHWLTRLLQPSPRDRFRCAAEARWALSRIEGTVAMAGPRGASAQGPTLTAQLDFSSPSSVEPSPPVAPRREDRPLPWSDWRDVAPPAVEPVQPPEPGLALHGLRPLALFGREPLQDALWERLRQVRRTGRAQAVLLRGAAGTGKSRLAQWLSVVAVEAGLAASMTARFYERSGAHRGLVNLVRRVTVTGGLDVDGAASRLATTLPNVEPAVRMALARVAAGESLNQRDLLAALRVLVSEVGRDRPVVLWLDDVVWSPEAIALAELLCEPGSDVPVLIVLTARSEDLAGEAERSGRLTDLGDRYLHLEVQPLASPWCARVLCDLLRLDGDLAAQVEERTGGNPLFMVEVVGAWIAENALRWSPGGYRLAEGARHVLPDGLHDVWRRRIEGMALRDDLACQAVERAAVLGREVHVDEWRLSTTDLQGVDRPGITERLLEIGLAVATEDGWAFAHDMLVESLCRTARERGRLASHHAACVRALQDRRASDLARLGRHLLGAGRQAEGRGVLLEALREHLNLGNARRVLSVAAELEEPGPPTEGRGLRTEVLLRIAQARVVLGRYAEARAMVTRVLAMEPTGILWAEVHITLGGIELRTGAFELAVESNRVGWEGAAQVGHHRVQVGAMVGQIEALMALGRSHEARDVVEQALAVCASRGLDPSACQTVAARVFESLGDSDQAWSALSGVAAAVSEDGRSFHFAACLNELGELSRTRGRLDEAEAHYRRSLALFRAIGSRDALVVRLNLSNVLLLRGRDAEARTHLLELLRWFERVERHALRAATEVLLMECAAGLGEWGEWEVHWGKASELLDRTGFVQRDVACSLASSVRLAWQAGQRRLARLPMERTRAMLLSLGLHELLHALDALASDAESRNDQAEESG